VAAGKFQRDSKPVGIFLGFSVYGECCRGATRLRQRCGGCQSAWLLDPPRRTTTRIKPTSAVKVFGLSVLAAYPPPRQAEKGEAMTDEGQTRQSRLSQRVEEEVQRAINSNLRLYKVAVASFIAGFALFISVGLLTRGEMFKVILKSFYPPEDIYADVVDEFLKDKEFRTELVNKTDYGELVIPNATLKTFPAIGEQLPKTVWSTVSSGKEDDYGRMISRREFFDALVKYHTDLAKSFLLPTSSQMDRASRILEVGKIPLEVQLLMAGSQAEGENTAVCYKTFRNAELQAIMVIPESAREEEYSWFNCSFGWPEVTLKVNGVDGIRLVGVRRNGKTKNLILLLSQKAAESLELVGWDTYTANSFGKVVITNAE